MTEPQNEQARDDLAQVGEEIEDEQQSIELPAREAFSLVWSSPAFLHATGVAEQVFPEEPGPEPPA